MVNSTSNIDSRLSELFAYLNAWIFGAGQRGSDNRGSSHNCVYIKGRLAYSYSV